MKNENLLERIIIDSNIMVGKPVIKGTRITVQLILRLLGQGMSYDDLLQNYPNLTKEDIQACFLFVTKKLDDVMFAPLV